MSVATITSKGQTTIPKDIRDSLGLKAQDQITFTLLPDGTVIMRARKRKLSELSGMLTAPKGRKMSLDQMTPWR